MISTTTSSQGRQELATRHGAGIEVTLFWSASDDALTVRVVDHFNDEYFEIPVNRDVATYAFHHPFAYAAECGLDHDSLVRPAA
jgi:hypothetical protein